MSSSVGESFGVGKQNESVELGRFESVGPASIVVRNLSTSGVAIVRVEKSSDASLVATNKDTAVSAEGTGYTGNGSTTDFSGQVLNNLPVIPGTITINDAGGSYDLVDGGDGVFYTDDDDEDEAGTINYFTGAMTLSYPTGKEPSGGAMTADYYYQDSTLGASGLKTFQVSNVQQGEELVVKGASDLAAGTRMRVEMISSWE